MTRGKVNRIDRGKVFMSKGRGAMKDHYRRSSPQGGKVIIMKRAWKRTVREVVKDSGPGGQVQGFISRGTLRRDQGWLMVRPKIAGNGRSLAAGGGGGSASSASGGLLSSQRGYPWILCPTSCRTQSWS